MYFWHFVCTGAPKFAWRGRRYGPTICFWVAALSTIPFPGGHTEVRSFCPMRTSNISWRCGRLWRRDLRRTILLRGDLLWHLTVTIFLTELSILLLRPKAYF